MNKEVFFFDLSDDIFSLTKNKDIPLILNVSSILQSVRNILETEKGERTYNPKFGCDLNKFVFNQLDYAFAELIKDEIKNCLLLNEPRLSKVEVETQLDFDNENILITINLEIESNDKNYKIETSLKDIR